VVNIGKMTRKARLRWYGHVIGRVVNIVEKVREAGLK
jgi:hypothetical protein